MPPEEDRATAIGNVYKKCDKDWRCISGDMLASQFSASLPGGVLDMNFKM